MNCFRLMYDVEPLIRVEIGPLGLDIMINSRKPEPGQDGDVLGDRAHLLLLSPPLSSSLSCLVCCWFHPSDTDRLSQVAWLFGPPLCESGRAVAGWQEGVLDLLQSSDNAGKYLKMLKKIFEDIWPACMHRVGQTLPCKCAYCWSDYKPPCWRGVGLIKLKLRPEVWQASLKNKVKPSYFNTWGPIVLFVDYFWSIVIVFAREWRVHSAWALQQL